MTPPDAPLRMELVFELPGTPQQVWEAVATANGISSWFLPTDLDPRVGGVIVTHMGETESPGEVTDYDAPRRFAYEEPGWASLTGHDDAAVTPLATEFLVEAQAGGPCVVRVVSSAFGTGADWEREFFADMENGWRPYFDRLRLYLSHYPGRPVTVMGAEIDRRGPAAAVLPAVRQALGISAVGQAIDARGTDAIVERIAEADVLLRTTAPVPGFLAFLAWDIGDGRCQAVVQGQFFSDEAPEFVEREQPRWEAWLKNLDLERA